MSEPTIIIYQSDELQYWYGEEGSLLCQYQPALWHEGYSAETFGVPKHETELIKAISLATKRAEAADARRREIDDEADRYVEQIEVLRAERDALRREIDDEAFGYAEQVEALRAERDALRKDMALLREFVLNDGIAMTYQTLGQYRAALLKFSALEVQP